MPRRLHRRWRPRFTGRGSCGGHRERPGQFHALLFVAHGAVRAPPCHSSGEPRQLEDVSGVQYPQRAGSAIPGFERLCAARSEPDENRIAAAAGEALGVPILCGLSGAGGYAQRPERAEPFAGTGRLPARAGVLSEGCVGKVARASISL